jgi:hypothetical protein
LKRDGSIYIDMPRKTSFAAIQALIAELNKAEYVASYHHDQREGDSILVALR